MDPSGDSQQHSEGKVRRGRNERMRDIRGKNAVPLHQRKVQIVHADRDIGDDLQLPRPLQKFAIHSQFRLIHDADELRGKSQHFGPRHQVTVGGPKYYASEALERNKYLIGHRVGNQD